MSARPSILSFALQVAFGVAVGTCIANHCGEKQRPAVDMGLEAGALTAVVLTLDRKYYGDPKP
jgi:hypothetical protein